ncbi:MAG TPA: LPS assembly protein LptD [Bryobacteraceae bacterium]|nr:LPS assembly protein LptD [Bryobacteraceae bacterium]
MAALVLIAHPALAQEDLASAEPLAVDAAQASSAAPAPPTSTPPSSDSTAAAQLPGPPPPSSIPAGQWEADAVQEQKGEGKEWELHGNAWVEGPKMLIRADNMTWDQDSGQLHATGHVYLHNFERNEEVWCDRMDYDTKNESGMFYNVRGQMVPRLVTRPGMLTSHSPFYFQGEWAERNGGVYILHHGYITNCKIPAPWWRLRGPKFLIVPGDKAVAYKSTFWLKHIPLFFTPYFYHSLETEPRRSGFLTPNISHSSIGGVTLGIGYFWAINRSYDVTYRLLDYTSRGLAHHLEISGKPRPGTDFYVLAYGVQDRGVSGPNTPLQKYSGISMKAAGKSVLGDGWTVHGEVNYVSSFRFVQQWSQSYSEVVGSETHSTGFANKDWSAYSLDVVASRTENFQTVEVPIPSDSTNYVANAVVIRKLPEIDFSGRDQQIFRGLPLWFSFDASGGLLSRSAPYFNTGLTQLVGRFQTGRFMNRENIAPHITGAFHFGDFHLVPTLGLYETYYSQGQTPNLSVAGQTQYQDAYQTTGSSVLRSAREFSLDLIFPTISRVFDKKTFLGDKLKHVIEPRATYTYVTGIGSDFDNFIRFDENELLTNTSDVMFSVTNRIYAKRGDSVQEIFTWELAQKRYFDPTFGGALIPGQRNVFDATADVDAFAFLVAPRGISPVVSNVRVSPVGGIGIRWQADYDTAARRIADSTVAVDYRYKKKYFASIANSQVHLNPLLTPTANQYGFRAGYGDANRTGWNGYVTVNYNPLTNVIQNSAVEATYNTDCCGLSVQYYRINLGLRDETGWRFAFAIANVGTFGTLKKQDRTF